MSSNFTVVEVNCLVEGSDQILHSHCQKKISISRRLSSLVLNTYLICPQIFLSFFVLGCGRLNNEFQFRLKTYTKCSEMRQKQLREQKIQKYTPSHLNNGGVLTQSSQLHSQLSKYNFEDGLCALKTHQYFGECFIHGINCVNEILSDTYTCTVF